ncbi:MAG: bacteriohemerythrin [Terriglobales bacterium]
MSETVSWRPEYSVKIAEFDRQHQNLFRIIESLHEAIAAGRGHEVTEAVLANVVNYTIHHFAAEENLMEQHGFPGTSAHRIEHNTLTLEIARLQKEHAAGKPRVAERFLRFLLQWLEEHILKTDKEYVEFLCARGVV